MENKLDGNYTRMLQTILNRSWRQHPTKQQLYCHLPPITKTIEVRRRRHAGHCWRSMDDSLVTYSCGPFHMDKQRQDNQLEPTYNSSMPIRNVALKTYRGRWMIEKGGERGWGRSALVVGHDDEFSSKVQIFFQPFTSLHFYSGKITQMTNSFFPFIGTRSSLVGVSWSVCISKFQRFLYV